MLNLRFEIIMSKAVVSKESGKELELYKEKYEVLYDHFKFIELRA